MASDRPGIKVTATDALEFEPVAVDAARSSGRGWKIAFFTLISVAVLTVGWMSYGDRLIGMLGDPDDRVPVVYAPVGAVRERPENPGGLQVPDRDKLVYNVLQGKRENAPQVERLLPTPETPLPRPKPKTIPVIPKTLPTLNDQVNSGQPKRLVPQTSPAIKTTPKVPTAADVASIEKPQPVKLPTPAPTVKKKIVKTTKPVTPKPLPRKTVSSKKAYRVQLAAARSTERAQQEWDRLRRKHIDLLGDLGLTITKADLGVGKGVFYRLRVGPLKTAAQARKLCAELSKRKVGCLLIRPGG